MFHGFLQMDDLLMLEVCSILLLHIWSDTSIILYFFPLSLDALFATFTDLLTTRFFIVSYKNYLVWIFGI